MKYPYILFDLDGTLTDSGIGIINSVEYALKKLGFEAIDRKEMNKFIGPPLKDSFMVYCGYTEAEAELAINTYREYFQEKGIYENEVYPGIPELLEFLSRSGCTLAVATSKPMHFAQIIVDHFGIGKYFKAVIGSQLDGTRVKKAEVIEDTLIALGVEDKQKVVMIGDREHDIIGSKQIGIDSIGVEYGYGDYQELAAAGATYIVKTVEDLKTFLKGCL